MPVPCNHHFGYRWTAKSTLDYQGHPFLYHHFIISDFLPQPFGLQMSYSSFKRITKNRDMQELILEKMEISVFGHFRDAGGYKAVGGTVVVPPTASYPPGQAPNGGQGSLFWCQ